MDNSAYYYWEIPAGDVIVTPKMAMSDKYLVIMYLDRYNNVNLRIINSNDGQELYRNNYNPRIFIPMFTQINKIFIDGDNVIYELANHIYSFNIKTEVVSLLFELDDEIGETLIGSFDNKVYLSNLREINSFDNDENMETYTTESYVTDDLIESSVGLLYMYKTGQADDFDSETEDDYFENLQPMKRLVSLETNRPILNIDGNVYFINCFDDKIVYMISDENKNIIYLTNLSAIDPIQIICRDENNSVQHFSWRHIIAGIFRTNLGIAIIVRYEDEKKYKCFIIPMTHGKSKSARRY